MTASSQTPISLRQWLDHACDRLAHAGIDAPRREARLLLELATGMPVASQLLRGDDVLCEPDIFMQLVARRVRREPMAHLSGRQGFWTLELEVSPDTLIPRADSETLIEAILGHRPDRSRVRRVLDLGTGTGCLLLAVLSEYPSAYGVGVDRIQGATALARRNATANALGDRAHFLCGEWAATLDGGFDVVIANPPYITSADMRDLMDDVARYEPASALDGGADGLDDYRAIIPELHRLLAPAGLAVLEIGVGQHESVPDMVRATGLAVREIRKDLGGHFRAVVISREAGAEPV